MAQEPVLSENEEQTTTPSQTEQQSESHDKDPEAPIGAMVFGFLLLAFYFVYFFLQWYEIVVLRGGA